MDPIKKIVNSLNNNYTGGIIGEETALKAAVLIPLIKKESNWEILFEVRAFHLKSQPGDICFPGGKIDPTDPSPLDAALRETSEELGIKKTDIIPLGTLNRYIPSSSLIIYPFAGHLTDQNFSINKEEVDHIFTIPLDWLLNAEPERHLVSLEPQPGEDFPYEKISQGREYSWKKRYIEEFFYHYKDHSVWGMTARILNHFLAILKS